MPQDAITQMRIASHDGDWLKGIAFGAFALAVPALSRRLAASERALDRAYFALGFSVFVPIYLTLGDRAESMWRLGIYRDTFSFEITIVDLLAVLLYATQRRRRVAWVFPGPLTVTRALYLLAMLASLLASPDPYVSLFSVFKLLRAYFVFTVVAAGFRELRAIRACTSGLALGAAAQAPLALVQRYAWHVTRPSGTVGSSNNLSLTLDFIAPIAVALLLAGVASRITLCAAISCAICPMIGQSRAGTILFGGGAFLVCAGSLMRQMTKDKVRKLGGLAAIAVIPVCLYLPAVIRRWNGHLDWSWIERMRMSRAALLMIHEHPWGVGVNMYSWVLNHAGYARITGVNMGDRQVLVHNYYYMITAELGYPGIIAFALLLLAMAYYAARAAFLRGFRGDIGLGALVAFVLSAIDNWEDMSPTSRQPLYALWIVAAIACSLRVAQETSPKGVARR